MSILKEVSDVEAPTRSEQINLDDFEGSNVIPLVDDGEDMSLNNPEPTQPDTVKRNTEHDEFAQMQDEQNGFELESELYPTEDFLNKSESKEEEEEVIEQEEENTDSISVDEINKALGSNFKNLDEARAFGKVEPTEELPVITEKESQNYTTNISAIDYLEKVSLLSDDKIIREDLLSKAIAKNNGEAIDEEAKQDIEFRIERYRENGTDTIVAENIRDRINKSIDSRKSFNKGIDEKKREAENLKKQKNQEGLKESFRTIFGTGKYLGVPVTEEDIKKTYQSVISGEFHKRLNKDHEFTAKLALTAHLQDRLNKATSKGSFADGIDAIMSEVDGKSTSQTNRSRARQVSTRSQSGNASLTGDPLVDGFLK